MQGNSSSDTGEYGMEDMKEVKKHVEQHGVSGIENFFKDRLDEWKDVEVNIGITGDSGVGKSSFINAIRGVKDDDEFAAATGITETTRKTAKYPHPTNPKITFWDLPGIGTPNYPNLKTYCKKVKLEKLDTFLILTAKRFTENDRLLAEKVKSLKKSYFFIRTQIDIDYENERRKRGFNEEAMLNNIRENCLRYLKANDEVFLISNRYPAKWEFARLTQAILDVFPFRQKECLTLSLGLLTSFSKDILRRKIELLRGRIYKVAIASCVGALIPIPGLSIAVDIVLLRKEVNLYKSQFGLPEENSAEFQRMTRESQEIMRKSCLSASIQILNRLAVDDVASNTVEEFIRYIPVVGSVMAGGLSYATTSRFLHQYLKEMEGVALALLDEINIRSREDSDINLLNDILKRKIKQIRDRIWMVAAASSVGALFSVCVGALFSLCVGALFPVSVGAPFLVFALSIVIDTALLTKEVKSYYSQVCLPEESSYEFETLTPTTQEKVRRFRFVTPARIVYLFIACAVSFGVEEWARYIPLVGSVAAGGISFLSTYYFLHKYLNIMEETAFECLERTRTTTRVVDSH